MLTAWAKAAFLAGLGGIRGGRLTLACPGRTYSFGGDAGGDLDGTLIVHNERFFLRALTGDDIGVLEIGSGWGGFAVRAATHYGCHVTTTTISDEQYRHLVDWRSRLGEAGSRIEVLRADYRELTGQFDKVVSIEMFEAVGFNHYDDYFQSVDRLLTPDGAMLLQTITVDDQWFPKYHGTPDWIEKYIFPGGELASIGEILKSLARATSLSMYHAENWGTHYARTLRAWRARFHSSRGAVAALGFDDRFVRMWDLYLACCEAAFLERHAGLYQLLLVKNGSQRALFNEPWSGSARDVAGPLRESAA
jgi:cyclopropane-fatty-acyl-phospholipid synthase